MEGFQRAVVELILDPSAARQVLGGDESLLLEQPLTERERERIRGIVQQPGLSLCCTLARANRFEAIGEVFPMTCVLLEPVLRSFLDEIWSGHRPSNYQFSGEEVLFVDAVRRGIETGTLAGDYLDEVFRYELACWTLAKELRRPPEERSQTDAIVEFRHAPDGLLAPLSRMETPPADLPSGWYLVKVRLDATGRFEVEVLSASRQARRATSNPRTGPAQRNARRSRNRCASSRRNGRLPKFGNLKEPN